MELKDPLVLKRAAPLLQKVRDLSLRRGDGGLRDLCRVFRKERIGPEEFKSEMSNFGIALSGAESTAIFQAFSDAIGYLLQSSFIDGVLSVLGRESTAAARSVFESLEPVELPLTSLQKKAGFTQARRVVSVTKLIQHASFGDDILVAAGVRDDATAQREFLDVFDQRYYPEDLVVEIEFLAYYAAQAFLAQGRLDDSAIAAQIFRQWGISGSSAATSPTKRKNGTVSLPPGDTTFALCQTLMGEAMPHKLKFKETRDKIDTPGRIVGYQGHLPTAAEHFGETFHRVEAAIPLLGKSDPDANTIPPPVDPSYGFTRQGNKANHHNFRFA
ncbi:Hypothetical protein, putative [Bodo saltans]|uniref:Uncharacterized protein n=1 Tax=Bodo saltans TaxID=75058 RepID=A0A0S4IKU6_BODSA|nr:Hypothetical protein, putative [Bodo saltans]|eukprot:CUF14430.1 Hypothetical protein, putative [Bodo saltans]